GSGGSTAGTSGTSTWFLSNTTILANGGGPGSGGGGGGGAGGVGGSSATGYGTTKWSGGNGAAGILGGASGGGGGGAGTTTNGGVGGLPTGGIGVAPGGNGGAGSTATSTPGSNGVNYGGGGGGARGGGSNVNGGNGAQGVIIISYIVCPQITQQPFNSSICQGASASFSIVASGGTITYQWQVSTNGGSTWSNVTNGGNYSGATTSSLSVNGATSGFTGYQYRCVLSNGCGLNINSNAATLTVNPIPNIFGSTTLCQGSTGTLTSSVSGSTWSSSNTSIATINSTSGFVNTLAPGSVTIIATSPAGCTGTNNLTVNSLPTLSTTQINNICFGGNTGSINLTASGGTPIAQTAAIDQQQASAGCGTTSGNFWQSFTPAISGKFSSIDININTNITNAGTWYVYSGAGQSGTILASGSYNFPTQGGALWKNIVITGNPVLIAGQQYTFRMTSVDWSQACGGNVYPGGTSQSGISDLSFKTYMIPNPYNYSWSNSAVTEDISSLVAGSYSVIVSDGNSCSATISATITQPTQITINNSTSNFVCSGTPLNIPISASGGTAPYTFSWIAQNNTNTNGESTTSVSSSTITDNITLTGSTAQNVTYSITTTDINACVVTNTIGVNVNPVATISSQSTASQTICSGNSFTALSVTAAGLGLTYQWYSNSSPSTSGGTAITGATSSSYTPPSSTAGITYYYCIVNGSCGTATTTVSGAMTVNATPTISGVNTLCMGTNTTLTAPGTGNTWTSSNTSMLTVSSGFVVALCCVNSGTATITATSPAGCIANFPMTVNPVAFLSSPLFPQTCSGNPLNYSITTDQPGTNYTWQAFGNSNVSGETTTSNSANTISDVLVNSGTSNQTVIYNFSLTTTAGCVGTQTISVSVANVPNFIASPISSTVCSGSNATLTAKEEKLDAAQTIANQVSWWIGTNNGWQTFKPSYSGKLLKVRLRTVTYSSPATVNINIYSGTPATGTLLGSASASKGAGIDSWDDYVFSGSGISVTANANYYIEIPSGPQVDWPVSTSNPYPNGQAYYGVSSPTSYPSNDFSFETYIDPNTYTWNPGALSGSSVSVSPTTLTTYTATGTNLSGCVSTNTVIVDINSASVGGTASSDQTICSGSSPSSITLTGNLGTIQWQESNNNSTWTNITGATSATLSSAQIGTLNVTKYFRALSTNGVCSSASSNTITVTVNPIPTGSANNTGPYCSGQTISLTSAGGTTYSWGGPNSFTSSSQNPNITGSTSSMSGVYTVTVTQNGCSSIATTTVTVNNTPTATASNTGPFCVGSTISLTASGGTTYSWSGPNAFSSSNQNPTMAGATSPMAGVYTVTVTQNGCTATANTSVVVNPATSISSQSTAPQTVCEGSSFNPISVTATGSGLNYQWYVNSSPATIGGTAITGATNSSYTPPSATAGTNYYYAIVNGSCGSDTSLISGAMLVNPSTLITFQSTEAESVCINGPLNSFSISATGTGLSYQWYNNTTASTIGGVIISGATDTIYQPTSNVSGTNYYYCIVSGGCGSDTSLVSGEITVNPTTSITIQSTSSQTVCEGFSFNPISISAIGSQLNYQWYSNSSPSTNGGTLINGAIDSIYIPTSTVTGTSYYYAIVNGICGSDTSFVSGAMIVNPGTTIISQSTSGQSVCLNDSLSSISVNASGTGISYQWFSNSVSSNSGGTAVAGATLPNFIPFSNVAGTNYYYCVVSGTCGTDTSNIGGAIVVNPNNTSTLSSAPGTSNQTVCITSPITNITYATTGATAIGSASGLPTGINANFSSNTITVSGTPALPGLYNFTIPLLGGCGSNSATGTITVTPINTTSTASSTPTLCINTSLTNITHTTTGATGISTPTGLPAGVTASWTSNTITISGTPTASGTFNYSIPLTGGCGNVSATGTIIVTPANTVGAASSTPTLCINTALNNITHTTTGATGIGTATGLPIGVTAAWISDTITISGTPISSGTFSYSIPVTGGCGNLNATGTIIVNPANTVDTASSTPTLCINTTLTNITHTTTGATGIGTPTGLPAGITATWVSNTIAISGTPTASGTFSYTIPLSGGCGTVNTTGVITVTPANTVSAASSTPTLCINTTLTNITHTTTVATGIGTPTGLPAGVTAAWASNIITISGTPTASGTFSYSIPLTGGCGNVIATGNIIVNPNNTVSLTSPAPTTSQTICINNPITNITYATTGATGASFTGLPSGLSGSWASNIVTI
ncbi:MAG: PKD-like domain-containing protein, partial [Bacteroidota bacterium]